MPRQPSVIMKLPSTEQFFLVTRRRKDGTPLTMYECTDAVNLILDGCAAAPPTLTPDERRALESVLAFAEKTYREVLPGYVDALQGLLERTRPRTET